MSKDTSTFSVSAAKALFEAAKKPEVRNAAIAAAKNPFVRQTARNVAQDERARGAVLNAVKDPSGGNKISAAFAVADANRKADGPPPPPPHRVSGAAASGPGKLSSAHSAIRSQLESLHIGGSTSSTSSTSYNAPSATSPSFQSSSSSSHQSTYKPAPPAATSYSSAPPPPVPRHHSTTSSAAPSTPHGIAIYDYDPTQHDEMALRIGNVVLLSKKVDTEWVYGENQSTRQFGMVPSSYLDIKIPLIEPAFSTGSFRSSGPSGDVLATALFEYTSSEIGDLTFGKGAQIKVVSRVNAEWLEGEYLGRTGIFPVGYVDCPDVSRLPMKQTTSSSPKQTVTVIYDYNSGVRGDLVLEEGDVVTVLEDIDAEWVSAEHKGRRGLVAKNFLGLPYNSPPNKKKKSKGIAEIASAFSPKKARAIGDYHSEDSKHLYVTRGDVLLIVEDVDDYYYKGKVEAFKTLPAGIVPKNIVQFID